MRLGAAVPLVAGLALGWRAGEAAAVQSGAGHVARALTLPTLAHRARAGGVADADVRQALERMRDAGTSAADAASVLEAFLAVPPERRLRHLPELAELALDGPRERIAYRARAAMTREEPTAPAAGVPDDTSHGKAPARPRAPDTLGRPMSDTQRLLRPPKDDPES